MAHYRKIDVSIHNDAKYRSLSDKAKLLLFTLLTHPNLTGIGAMRMTQSGMAEEMDWHLKAFQEAFQEVLAKGMARYDEKAFFLCFPRFLKHNRPESPNVVKSWSKLEGLLPECELKSEYIQIVLGLLEGFGEAYLEGFPYEIGKASPYQEQEQEQEQEQDKKKESSQKLFNANLLGDLWNNLMPPAFSRVLLPFKNGRKRKLLPAIRENPDLEWWKALFIKAGNTPFLQGDNDRGWKADLEFVVKKRIEILEGRYDRSKIKNKCGHDLIANECPICSKYMNKTIQKS